MTHVFPGGASSASPDSRVCGGLCAVAWLRFEDAMLYVKRASQGQPSATSPLASTSVAVVSGRYPHFGLRASGSSHVIHRLPRRAAALAVESVYARTGSAPFAITIIYRKNSSLSFPKPFPDPFPEPFPYWRFHDCCFFLQFCGLSRQHGNCGKGFRLGGERIHGMREGYAH